MHDEAQDIHVFDNGVKVYRHHLIPVQLERYSKHNIHEPEEEELLGAIIKKLSGQACIFVNAGSAIGYYVILVKKHFPDAEVHSFEPLASHVDFQLENLRLNEVESNIIIHRKAISSQSRKTEFINNGYESCLLEESFCQVSRPKPERLMKVESITLDEFMLNSIVPYISLLQMDVQGFECDVIAGAEQAFKQKRVLHVLIGTHSTQLHETCMALLKKVDYSIEFERYDCKYQHDGIIYAVPS